MSGLAFYDWETADLIRRIEITPKTVSVFMTALLYLACFLNRS